MLFLMANHGISRVKCEHELIVNTSGTVVVEYTYDAWGTLTSTTSSDGTPPATHTLYWQPRTAEGNFSLFYTHDGNKNVSEAVFYQRARGVAAHDEYAPFGEVTAQTRGNAWGTLDLATDNPWRFSCEYEYEGIQCVGYNFRIYNTECSQWTTREPIGEIMSQGCVNARMKDGSLPAATYVKTDIENVKGGSKLMVDDSSSLVKGGTIYLCNQAKIEELGGCGCAILHELIHRSGLFADEIEYDAKNFRKDKAVVKISQILVKGTKLRCKGYGE